MLGCLSYWRATRGLDHDVALDAAIALHSLDDDVEPVVESFIHLFIYFFS